MGNGEWGMGNGEWGMGNGDLLHLGLVAETSPLGCADLYLAVRLSLYNI